MEKKQMNSRKWTILTLGITGTLLLIFAVLMFVTDPLLYFRKESKVLTDWQYNQLYSGPGVARQYDYDTVAAGSCMIQQFDMHQIDELYGGTSVKLTYNGATARNVKTILDICFETHPDLKRVFIPMDIFLSTKGVDEYSYSIPEYMYSCSAENTVKYLLNGNIFYHVLVPDILGTLQGETHDAMEAEPEDREYGAQLALAGYIPSARRPLGAINTDAYLPNTEANLSVNILPLIEQHPDTEFIFFVPPYSILYWDKLCATQAAEPSLESLRMMFKAVLPYDNVKVYSYLWDEEIITNLDNYRDVLHFSPEVQSLILEKMYRDEGRVTEENCDALIDAFLERVRTFDYEALYDSYMQPAEN